MLAAPVARRIALRGSAAWAVTRPSLYPQLLKVFPINSFNGSMSAAFQRNGLQQEATEWAIDSSSLDGGMGGVLWSSKILRWVMIG